jgi:DNA repair exonuclease SbcCD nuclease subunit
MKILHTSDLHLDGRMRGLERYRAAPVESVHERIRTAFDNLVQTAIDEKVSLVLIAGDVYDGDWRDFQTAIYFAGKLATLRDAGIRVVIAGGNQDAVCPLFTAQRLPDNVRVLSSEKVETAVYEDLGTAVHGRSFKRPDSEDVLGGFPQPINGLLNIGLLHTSTEGFAAHAVFAPCKVGALVKKGYAYWALGHVHARCELHRDPWVVYPGSIQGRSIAESGPHGCALVTADGHRIVGVEMRDLDAMRWGTCEVDIAEAETADEVVERFRKAIGPHVAGCGGRLPLVRVRVFGAGPAHREFAENIEDRQNEFRSTAHSEMDEELWVESVSIETEEEELHEKLKGDDAIGGLIVLIDRICKDDAETDRLSEGFGPLREALPPEFLAAVGADRHDRAAIRRALQDVKQLLVPRLLSIGGAP